MRRRSDRAPGRLAAQHAFAEGDRVTWTCHAKGFGYSVKVAAVVVALEKRYAEVEVAEKRSGRWVRTRRRVPICLLVPRRELVFELGES